MGWIAQLTGNADHPSDDTAREAETALADALRKAAQSLTDTGHSGVAATFTGDHVGTVNLLAEPAPAATDNADALGTNTPQPPAPGETQEANTAVPDGTPAPLPTEAAGGAQEAAPAEQGTPGYVTPPQGAQGA